MDITETLAPKSDQQNYDDYLTGPRTVTVSAVNVSSGEQPVSVELAEYPGRPFKPNKSMRRVLAAGWGAESNAWVGRRLTLFGNPAVVYGGKAVGGIEIAEMSNLDKPLTLPLTATRGKRKNFTVKPLADAPPARDFLAEAGRAGGDVDLLRALYGAAQKAGAPANVLEGIRALAAPAPDETPAS